MPITVTFDLKKARSKDLNRIRGFFERLGWEHLGNTAYRYPKLHSEHPTEDWFNHVVPALMMLRTFALNAPKVGITLAKFSIDVQSTTGFNPETKVGRLPVGADHVTFSDPSDAGKAFGQQKLKDWLDGVEWPYVEDQTDDDGHEE